MNSVSERTDGSFIVPESQHLLSPHKGILQSDSFRPRSPRTKHNPSHLGSHII